MARRQPEIILTDTPGELLQADALAYPEDTYLVVDPFSPLRAVETPFPDLVAEAEAILPRPVGEIITACVPEVAAARLFRLVLLDLNEPRPCRSRIVETILRRLIREVADLGVRHLGLDRFELLEPCISAYRLLSCPWGDRPKTHATWYEPFTDQETIDRAVAFVLSQPVSTLTSVGDVTVLPKVQSAAERFRPLDAATRDALLATAAQYHSPFVGTWA